MDSIGTGLAVPAPGIDRAVPEAGAGLGRLDMELQPAELKIRAQKIKPHYVISPAVDIDHRNDTWRRLSRKVFNAMRICLLETFHYPVKNRSAAKMENPGSEPDVIPWEKTAFDQSDELVRGYGIYGLVRLDSLTGLEPEVVSSLEKLFLPVSDNPDDYSIPNVRHRLLTEGQQELIALSEQGDTQAIFPIAARLHAELLAAMNKAEFESKRWLTDTEMEIDKARAGQKAKSTLDPLDFKLYKACGLVPKSDLLQRAAATVKSADMQFDRSILTFETQKLVSALEARVNSLESAKQAALQAREMKRCPYCASDIFKEAIFCKECKQPLAENLVIKEETGKKEVRNAERR